VRQSLLTPTPLQIAEEGVRFTDYYGEKSCTAGRAAFVTGQNPYRTGMTKVGMPGADLGLRAEDPMIATPGTTRAGESLEQSYKTQHSRPPAVRSRSTPA
jgi:hypothetical protein